MGARVLIIGSGGREHALAWRLARSPSVEEVLCAPGNAGIAQEARCLSSEEDVESLVRLAVSHKPDLVIVGPEGPLCAGLADALAKKQIPTFGPSRAAAELEGSKVFAKQLFERIGVPTAPFIVADDTETADRFIRDARGPLVVKADGLAAGKGVIVCKDAEEARAAARVMLEEQRFGEAGRRIIVEERLTGREASLLALVDGERMILLPPVEDHKAVRDGDQGPNTGGMGTYCPADLDAATIDDVRERILKPVVAAMAKAGHPYRGVLFAGLMLTPDRGPMLLEFNCRFGDPETQVLMARFADDLYGYLAGAAVGRLPDQAPQIDLRAAVCVVQCAEGYPGTARKGDEIQGVDEAAHLDDVMVFHAGTRRTADGKLVTAGGRVLGTTALGRDLAAARERAYEAVAHIHFAGEHHRTDIGARKR